jgi:hypothetical protein
MEPQTTDDDDGAETTGDGLIDLEKASPQEIMEVSRGELLAAAWDHPCLYVRTDGPDDTFIMWDSAPPAGVALMLRRDGWVLLQPTSDGMAQIYVGYD